MATNEKGLGGSIGQVEPLSARIRRRNPVAVVNCAPMLIVYHGFRYTSKVLARRSVALPLERLVISTQMFLAPKTCPSQSDPKEPVAVVAAVAATAECLSVEAAVAAVVGRHWV